MMKGMAEAQPQTSEINVVVVVVEKPLCNCQALEFSCMHESHRSFLQSQHVNEGEQCKSTSGVGAKCGVQIRPHLPNGSRMRDRGD